MPKSPDLRGFSAAGDPGIEPGVAVLETTAASGSCLICLAVQALEDLRDQPLIGEVAYRIDELTIRPLLFHHFAHTAYYLTVDALRNFERSEAIGPGPLVVPAITFWFMAAESYISTIYKTCVAISASGWGPPAGRPLRDTRKVVQKMTAVKTWIAAECPPSPPHNRLREFATFRNTLLHDLTNHAPRTAYEHTRFAARGEKCNQADLMEALSVSLETFAYFRSIFYGADLMPSISIGVAVEKTDVLASEVLYPAFSDILVAKDLGSAITEPKYASCPAELRVPMQFLIRTEGPTSPRANPRQNEQLIMDEYQDRAIQARPVDEAKFQIPSYTR
jgi:hypothetical protein